MELDSLWLSRLQQLIFKKSNDGIIKNNILLNDGFSEKFIKSALKNNYIKYNSDTDSLTMTDKLRYMPCTIAKGNLDKKDKANKFSDNDPQRIFSTFKSAKEYHLASIILLKNFSSVFDKENVTVLFPRIALQAFSCELYMKAILQSYEINVRGHELKKLFNRMPEVEKEGIINSFLKIGMSKDDFIKRLDDISEAFEVVRYANERTGIMIHDEFLAVLMNVLFQKCKIRLQAI